MVELGADRPLSDVLVEIERTAPNMSEEISAGETMHAMDEGGSADGYLSTGQWWLRRVRLALLAAGKGTADRILDLPCGHGRFMRGLRAEFPQARITACDIDRDGVDFCAATFDAAPVYGNVNPEEIDLKRRFDLIWCGSLLTHLDEDGWSGFLRLFEDHLDPGGVLMFTTLGRFVLGAMDEDSYGLTDEQRESIRQSYSNSGFGYCDDRFRGKGHSA